MILSFSRRFAFVHIPKCAGESVEMFCGPQLPITDLIVGPQPHRPRGWTTLTRALTRLGKHSGAAEIRRWLGPERYDRYFTFALVRHPEARVLSAYRYLHDTVARDTRIAEAMARGGASAEDPWPTRRAACLRGLGMGEDALHDLMRSGRDLRRSPALRSRGWAWRLVGAVMTSDDLEAFVTSPYLAEPRSLEPMVDLVSDAEGNLIVNHIVKLETLSQDWPEICARIGMEGPLPRRNASTSKAAPEVSESVRAAIARRYQRDYEAFGYPLP
jgi:hypothetical protein